MVDRVDIMAIGTHPDDVEFGCGGILCREAALGRSILIVDLTIGERATNGTPSERRLEAQAAAAIIGAKRICLDFIDCEVADNYENRIKLVDIIRRYRPRLVLAPSLNEFQQHPDHTATGKLVRAACRYARFAKILPDLPTHWVEGVLHFFGAVGEPLDFLIDVSDYVPLWKSMMECHRSQMKTYDYIDRVIKTSHYLGTMIGCQYAQGLVTSNPVKVDSVLNISQGVREL